MCQNFNIKIAENIDNLSKTIFKLMSNPIHDKTFQIMSQQLYLLFTLNLRGYFSYMNMILYMHKKEMKSILTLFRMGIFGAAHGWGEAKRPPP